MDNQKEESRLFLIVVPANEFFDLERHRLGRSNVLLKKFGRHLKWGGYEKIFNR